MTLFSLDPLYKGPISKEGHTLRAWGLGLPHSSYLFILFPVMRAGHSTMQNRCLFYFILSPCCWILAPSWQNHPKNWDMASTINAILTLTEYFCRIRDSTTNKGKGLRPCLWLQNQEETSCIGIVATQMWEHVTQFESDEITNQASWSWEPVE